MRTYCIALASRPDKWKIVVNEFPKLDLDVTRIEGVQHQIGHLGCIQSHQQVLSQVQQLPVMIIEDDIKVIGTKTNLEKALRQLPEDWDCLYMGATLTKPLRKYSPNLYRLKGGLTTHAIIYNSQEMIDEIIENAYDEKKDKHLQHIDSYMITLQEKYNCFITYPMVLTQHPGFSDTCNQWVTYDIILRSYQKFTDGYIRDNN